MFSYIAGIHQNRQLVCTWKAGGVTWKRSIAKYTFLFLQSPLRVKNITSSKKLKRRVLETPTVVDLTTESAPVRPSTVDRSGSTTCWKPVWGGCASWVHSVSEYVQCSYMFRVLAILCAWLSQKVKLSQGSTQHESKLQSYFNIIGCTVFLWAGRYSMSANPSKWKSLLDKVDTCAR